MNKKNTFSEQSSSSLCMKIGVLLVLLLFLCVPLSAQKLTVESMEYIPNDATASMEDFQRQDLNGNYAGVVKVMLAVSNTKFEGGGVLEYQEHMPGEYWVWLAKDSKRIKVHAPGYLPLELNFFNDYKIMIEPKRTYKLTLQALSADIVVMPTIESFSVKSVSFSMVHIKGGTFLMGSDDEEAEDAEKPMHPVTLSDYCIGQTEVTQELWEAVMGKNPSVFKGSKRPVEQVSWEDCQKFIQKLNKLTGRQFRLPTEAEWEYAARGGIKSKGYKYSGSNNIDDVAWYMENSGRKYITLGELLSGDQSYDNNTMQPHDVGTKQANELGLYDMSGNVKEWCQDWTGSYNSSAQANPVGPSAGTHHALRGGSFIGAAIRCRPQERYMSTKYNYAPGFRDYDLGFRLAL